jgi:Rieske 2Fe-2S family protein
MRASSADHLDEKDDVLFDSKRFQGTQKPLLEAEMLPAEVYNSRKWYLRELERAFLPSWTLVGRQDEIKESGKYLAIDTEWGGPVAVVRGKDGQLHAFANVCAHRGAKILQDGAGQAPRGGLICPYHAWTYDYSGQLMVAPGMNKTVGFDEDDIRLTPVRLELFHGFIFVCASGEAKGLGECLGDMPERLPEWFGPDGATQNMVCVARRTYDVPCNWKFIYENTCETYHTSVVHRASLGPMKSTPMEPHMGDWDGVRVPTKRTIIPLPADFEGENFPLPAFTNKSCFVNIYPSLQINVTWDCMWWMNTIPTSETSSRIEMGFCFPAATAKLDVFPDRLERYLHRWHTAVMEDNEISLNQQRGVRSVFRKPGRYCQLEFGTHNFNNWLLSRVLDNQAAAWQPGQRVFKSSEELWSNDDAQMLRLVDEASETVITGEGTPKDHDKAQMQKIGTIVEAGRL